MPKSEASQGSMSAAAPITNLRGQLTRYGHPMCSRLFDWHTPPALFVSRVWVTGEENPDCKARGMREYPFDASTGSSGSTGECRNFRKALRCCASQAVGEVITFREGRPNSALIPRSGESRKSGRHKIALQWMTRRKGNTYRDHPVVRK